MRSEVPVTLQADVMLSVMGTAALGNAAIGENINTLQRPTVRGSIPRVCERRTVCLLAHKALRSADRTRIVFGVSIAERSGHCRQPQQLRTDPAHTGTALVYGNHSPDSP